MNANSNYILGANVEKLVLIGTGAINGTGNGGANVLTGNGASNQLSGLGGADTVDGGDGADTVDGGTGRDRVIGGQGDDRLTGGAGNDTLRGGPGSDTYAFVAITDSGLTAAAMDLIDGFVKGADKIDVALIDAMAGDPGNDDFTLIGNSGLSAEGQIRFESVAGGKTRVELNIDGASGAEMAFLVKGNIVFADTDFIGLV